MAFGVGALALVVYVLTAARDIFPGDSPEFVTVALTGGVAHPPGYPLLSIVGALFGQLPLGPLPFRVNLVSAAAHAATVGVVFLSAERLTRNMLSAAAAAVVLAFGALFWSWSLVAEAFPLNDLLASLVLYFLIVWHERPAARWPLFAAAVTFGFGVANHQTITLLVPGFAWIVFDRRRELRGRARLVWQAIGLSVIAAALPYAYIPFAAANHSVQNWGAVQTPLDLARQFLRLDYGTGQLVPNPQYQGGTGLARLQDFARHFNPILAPLVALGFVSAWRSARWAFWALALMFFFAGPAFISYANANIANDTARFVLLRFYLLPQVIVAPLAGVGLVFLAEWLRRRFDAAPRWLRPAVAGIALAFAAIELAVTYPLVDRSNDHVAHDFALDILATAPANSVLLAGGDHILLPLNYVQAVEHVRPDVTVIAIPILPADWYQRELRLLHPELNVPLARFELADGLRVFMQANLGRSFALTGEQENYTFGGVYGTYGRGLLLPVIGPDAVLDLGQVTVDNERLLASYHIPSLDRIDRESFERFILDFYALVPWRLGRQYEDAKRYTEARAWYERALAIEPNFPEGINSLKRMQALLGQ
jgi:tetratricopeptide (TPR) repeat protein